MDDPQYTLPLNPELRQWYLTLDDDAQCFYQERAAIREFEGNQTRSMAERLAWVDTLNYLKTRTDSA